MKMCSAMVEEGHEVDLVGYQGYQNENINTYYGTNEKVNIHRFDVKEQPGETISLAIKHLIWVIRKSRYRNYDLIYSRNTVGLFSSLLLPLPFIYEIHSPPRTSLHKVLEKKILKSRKLTKVIFISKALERLYLEKNRHLNKTKTQVLADAADEYKKPKKGATLPGNSKYKAGYIGHLYPGKGGELIISIAKLLPNIDFHIVGGKKSDIDRLKSLSAPTNLHFAGHVNHSKINEYLDVFDVLLAPYSKNVSLAKTKEDIGKWMSPLKLFEYMSSGKAIICSRLPVLEEVMKDNYNCLLADPESAASWAECINKLTKNIGLKRRIEKNALTYFRSNHTWKIRAASSLKETPPSRER